MQYMKANDELDILFTKLQNRLNSTDVAPCALPVLRRGHVGANDTCLSHDWGSTKGRPRFHYSPDAAPFVNKNFCAPCAASWYVAVARNLMFGIVG